jgi:hypothetical protein
MALNDTGVDRRQFQFATLSGFASIVFASLNFGCNRETPTEVTKTPDNDSADKENAAVSISPEAQGGKQYADQTVKKAHDDAGLLVARLRRLDFGAERERHLFNMIRISEYAWAGLLTDIKKASEEIEQAESYCRKHGS